MLLDVFLDAQSTISPDCATVTSVNTHCHARKGNSRLHIFNGYVHKQTCPVIDGVTSRSIVGSPGKGLFVVGILAGVGT